MLSLSYATLRVCQSLPALWPRIARKGHAEIWILEDSYTASHTVTIEAESKSLLV